MKSKIKQVETYFRDCLVNGHFKVVSRDDYILTVLIDDEYEFALWVANGEGGLDFFNEFGSGSYMRFKLTEQEKNLLWKQLFLEKHKESYTDKKQRLLEAKERINNQLKELDV